MELLNRCPSTLKTGYNSYSQAALRALFKGRQVDHVLSYFISDAKKEQRRLLNENRTRISISGVQEKYSFKLEKKILRLVQEKGEYIIKPIPTDLENVEAVPANEHLTMQLATQLYKLDVAKNAMIFFADGEPAYITKRFDVMPNGNRCLKEDFCSLLQKTSESNGKNYKYEGSYADMAAIIDDFIPAAMVAKEKFFQLLLFNYLFSNGDAHLKNYSVIDYLQDGHYQLAPAYDLLCTRLHIEDGDMALEDGLYEKDYEHPSFGHYGIYAYDDFYDFGLRIGLLPKRIAMFLQKFLSQQQEVESLVSRSFLSATLQQQYLHLYYNKLKRIGLSLSKKI
jgi:serine/threonine-protein kinase HipA